MALERCRCGAPRRAGQKNCRQCHREDERRRRKHQQEAAEQLRERCALLIGPNQQTKAQFRKPATAAASVFSYRLPPGQEPTSLSIIRSAIVLGRQFLTSI